MPSQVSDIVRTSRATTTFGQARGADGKVGREPWAYYIGAHSGIRGGGKSDPLGATRHRWTSGAHHDIGCGELGRADQLAPLETLQQDRSASILTVEEHALHELEDSICLR